MWRAEESCCKTTQVHGIQRGAFAPANINGVLGSSALATFRAKHLQRHFDVGSGTSTLGTGDCVLKRYAEIYRNITMSKV